MGNRGLGVGSVAGLVRHLTLVPLSGLIMSERTVSEYQTSQATSE